MAMLAEKRSKQKWSEDPRNIAWSKDQDRYGYQMLEKMGWANGKGLGIKQNGTTSHVKVKKRREKLGLGAKESHDQDWIAQQEDFNNLLSALQQHGGNAELKTEDQNKKAMLEVAKASRKRVFYKKFIRSKDTSQYSKKDLACIFGKTASQSAPATPQNQSDDEARSEDSSASCPAIAKNPTAAESGFVTYTSKHNIQEYFAHRMKALRDGKGYEGIKEDNDGHEKNCEASDGTSVLSNKKEKKKAKKKRKEITEDEKDCIEVDAPKQKRKKKRMKMKDVSEGNREEFLTNEKTSDSVNVKDESEKRGGRSKVEDEPKRKKSKKKKKSKKDSLEC